MPIYEMTFNNLRRIEETSFDMAGFTERGDLQRLLRGQINVVAPDLLIITEEFSEWEDSSRRIDLLALDKAANLVVIELKRSEDGGHMDLQALRYAAMVSPMSWEKVVEVHGRYLSRFDTTTDARAAILAFLGWTESEENRFAQAVRIILVSADFSKELTTSVIWLNDQGLDIRCIRIKPYTDNGRVLVDVQQVIPLPEAAAYQVQIREKAQKERLDRSSERDVLWLKFWESLLQRAALKTELHQTITAGMYDCLNLATGVRGVILQYLIRKENASVRIYIDRGPGSRDLNKVLFDVLISHKAQIEIEFGDPLLWDRMDGRQASAVTYGIALGGLRTDQSRWPEIQDAMIGGMIRLDRAVKPRIHELRAALNSES